MAISCSCCRARCGQRSPLLAAGGTHPPPAAVTVCLANCLLRLPLPCPQGHSSLPTNRPSLHRYYSPSLPPCLPACLPACLAAWLQDAVVQAKYGFLYSSYSCRFPYWETTEMLRKFAIAFMPVRRRRKERHSGGGSGGGVVACERWCVCVCVCVCLRVWRVERGREGGDT